MKKAIGITILLIGLYLISFSSWQLARNNYMDNKYLLECEKTAFTAKSPTLTFDSQACIIKLDNKLTGSNSKAHTILYIGIAIMVSGLILTYRLVLQKLMLIYKNKSYFIEAFEVFINLSYWFLIGMVYLAMQLIVKTKVTGCVVDSMFIFYMAGLIGFYTSYFWLTEAYFAKKKIGKWFLGAILSIFTGFLAAYFIPFYLPETSKIMTTNWLNGAFLNGFFLMSFFVFANVIIGLVFSGFFKWVRIIYPNALPGTSAQEPSAKN